MKRKAKSLFATSFVLLALFLTACTSSYDRIVIDGAEAHRISTLVRTTAVDYESELRGNSPSNLRHGGHVLIHHEELYFLSEMIFAEDESISYLQKIPLQALGSDTLENEILTELNGCMLGFSGEKLYYIDYANNHRLSSFDLYSFESEVLSADGVSVAQLFADELYYSYAHRAGLFKRSLAVEAPEEMLDATVGPLVAISQHWALVYTEQERQDSLTLLPFDPQITRLEYQGHSFENVEVLGEWIFFTEAGCLWRLNLTGGSASPLSLCRGYEYAFGSSFLLVAFEEGGIFLARVDGTEFTQIARDRAQNLSIIDSYLFYHNLNDEKQLYVLNLDSKMRSIVQGDTVIDGGSRIKPLGESEQERAETYWGAIAELIRGLHTETLTYQEFPAGPYLLVDFTGDAHKPIYYFFSTEGDQDISAVATLVSISYQESILGYYTDESEALRLDTHLTFFKVNELRPLFKLVVQGKPPSPIKHGSGDRVGLPRSWEQPLLAFLGEEY